MSDALGRLLMAVCMLAVSGAAFGQEQPPAQPSPVHSHAPDATATIFPTMEASGTAWLPSLTPMAGVHGRARGWELMLHGTCTHSSCTNPEKFTGAAIRLAASIG